MNKILKKIKFMIKLIFIISLGLIVGYMVFWIISKQIYIKKETNTLIGTFLLDLEKTNLGIYSDSIEDYQNLIIEFKKDKTFRFNKSVPFIADTVGTWEFGYGLEEWHYIYYDSWKLKYKEGVTGDQFSRIYKENFGIMINSITPRADQLHKSDVRVVYFKKIEDPQNKNSLIIK